MLSAPHLCLSCLIITHLRFYLENIVSHCSVFKSRVVFSQWAFGVTLWELMTLGQTPYVDIDPFEMSAYLKDGYRIAQPINCPDELYVDLQSQIQTLHFLCRVSNIYEKINTLDCDQQMFGQLQLENTDENP